MTNQSNDSDFEVLIDYLKRTRGFDFSGYKRPSLVRRINKRMQMIKTETYSDYVDYLEVHHEEFVQLFNTILINVTGFFRDPASWDFIGNTVIPRLLATKGASDPGVERAQRVRRGSVHGGNSAVRGAWPGEVPRTGQDI